MNSRTKIQGKVVTSFLAVLSITAGLALNACDVTDKKELPGSTTSGTTTKMSDSDLEKSIKTKLDSDTQLKAADISVSASADRNEATISGTVETQALRSKAVELVKSTHAALILTDKIEVKPRELTRAEWTEDKASETRTKAKASGESIGNSLDDAWIHTKIVTQLIGNSATPQRKINVDVNSNMVTLRGTVETMEEKNEAERVAKATEGVKRVTNQLKVSASKMTSPSPRAT